MKIKNISEQDYEKFVKNHELASFYQSINWLKEKQDEGKKVTLVGLYENDRLVGVSLVIYLRILKNKKMAYASRGFIYDYHNVLDFKNALKEYFSDCVFVRIDPPIILATYDNKLNRQENVDNLKLINTLKENGFKHFGFNMAAETFQFRFIHRLIVKNSWEEQLNDMSKSTRKNIELASFKGVKSKLVDESNLDEVIRLFNKTMERKQVKGFPKSFYEYLIKEFKDDIKMYIIYIDKQTYLNNLKQGISDTQNKLNDILKKMEHDHVGTKLTVAKKQAINTINKYEEEIKKAASLEKITNIASMLTIKKYQEVVSLTSGMDNDYREFCPKYVMYPEMIKDAILNKLKYVNFLGVKNITDPHDKDHGVYEVKRGFGGETVEYIGEFDLPIKPFLYKLYKLKNKN